MENLDIRKRPLRWTSSAVQAEMTDKIYTALFLSAVCNSRVALGTTMSGQSRHARPTHAVPEFPLNIPSPQSGDPGYMVTFDRY